CATSGLALRELRRLASLVQAGLLPLDDASVSGQEALALERHAQVRIDLDERAGDAVPDGAGLSARPAAVDADAEVVLTFEPGDAERGEHHRAVRQAREVLLDRLAVEPGLSVAGPQDHACDRRLSLSGSKVLGDLRCQIFTSSGSGFCASCGCSGP